MSARKTIDVETVREMANHFLENSPSAEETSDPVEIGQRVGQREATANLLASVLHETGNYKGFRYLDAKWSQETPQVLLSGDESRRYY